MKLPLPKRRIWRVAIYIVCTLLIVLAIDLILVQLGRRIPHSYSTTRITEPTLSNGDIDYLTAIENHFGTGVTNENNAAPLILLALGRKALPPNQPPNGITDRLGMPPLPETGDYFQEQDKFYEVAQKADDPKNELIPLMTHPWKATDRPRTAAWLAANEKPLAVMIEASKRPRYFMPANGGTRPESLGEILLPHLRLVRDAGRALVCRAMLKIQAGDIEGAHEDLLAAHGLAHALAQGITLIDRLVSYAIDNIACTAEASIAASGKLDASQAKRWLADFQQLPPSAGIADCVDNGERYFFLDAMQLASRKGMARLMEILGSWDSQYSMRPYILWHFVPVRMARSAEIGNHFYDRLTQVMSMPLGQPRRQAIVDLGKEFNALAPWNWTSVFRSDWPLPLMMFNRQQMEDRIDTAQVHRDLATTALNLAVIKSERGTYPPMFAMSEDLFSGKPLVYRPTNNGYVLYSVGPNGLDDVGNQDDIAVTAGPAPSSKP